MNVKAIIYEDLLQQISDGTFKEERIMSGTLVIDKDPGHGAELNVSVLSFDNYALLAEAYVLYEHALIGSKWGDAVILSEFIIHNGVINNKTLYGDIGNLMIERSKNNLTIFEIWQNTTTNRNLKNYYNLLQKQLETQLIENYIDNYNNVQYLNNQQQILKSDILDNKARL
ncbi:hypothetical protein KGF54_005671 [Candida jiufengensis]|uniref:uncharacterized protein n=1 Tax=Candida jiufengensis TaxID=497108 RepID=UPI002225881A|nr:uncharacterized protein KGF54_005671 [Candida jiufengensis]KAI5949436.1 hypothetical protein KGF54_005671 [Candida jiufengensis]